MNIIQGKQWLVNLGYVNFTVDFLVLPHPFTSRVFSLPLLNPNLGIFWSGNDNLRLIV